MPDCPSDLTMTQFIGGQLAGPESDAIRLHAAGCRACSATLQNMLEIGALDAVGGLPPLATAERAALSSRLTAGATNAPQSVGPGAGADKTKIIDLFFPAAAAAGVAAMTAPLMLPSILPALGADDDAAAAAGSLVRNEPESATISPEQYEASASASGNDKVAMTMDGGSRDMQQAIDNFFGPGSGAADAPANVGQPGSPGEVSYGVYQNYEDTCAIRCQELVLKDFGIPVTQEQLIQEAHDQGWYVPGQGTPAYDLGKLIEAHGLDINRYEHANIFNLVNELAQGHRVIIAVDAGELWSGNPVLQPVAAMNAEIWEDWRPDHAVLVTGVDIADPGNPLVVVADPGTGEVAAKYPLAEFLEAWEDSGFSMVATHAAPDHFGAPNVAWIGQLAYDDFARWYPSVAGLTGQEPQFLGLCSDFDRRVQDAQAVGSGLLNNGLVDNEAHPLDDAPDSWQPPDTFTGHDEQYADHDPDPDDDVLS